MKNILFKIFTVLLVASFILAACAPSAEQQETQSLASADLSLVGSSNSKLFLGEDYNSDGVLNAFYKETGYKVFVKYGIGGPEAQDIKNSVLNVKVENKTSDVYDGFIFDDQLFAAGLKDTVYPSRSFVGVWIRQDKANSLGLSNTNPYLTHNKYATILESGSAKIVTAPANSSTASALEFFATMASCSGNPTAPIDVQVVLDQTECGKRIYDHYARSEGSTGDAVKIVFNDSLNGTNLFDGVLAFQSSFAGKNGLNQQLVDNGKQPFLFFYFSDASPVANMVVGNTGNLTEKEKVVYDEFAKFINEETAQQYVADAAITSGSSAFGVNPRLDTFNADWGLLASPNVTAINPPVYAVAIQALSIYRDFYKRDKYVLACLDVSPSTYQNTMEINVNGSFVDVWRIQAMNRAIQKITDTSWLEDNKVAPGKDDVFEYYFFSSQTTSLVARSVGTDTLQAGDRIDSIIGPWQEDKPTEWNEGAVKSNLYNQFNGFTPNGTEMFDCANQMLTKIISNYSPDIDYYIVILTDGENSNKVLNGDEFYDNWNSFSGKTNVNVLGIAFGTKGESINKDYTAKFGGATFFGDNDEGLLDAFKAINGR